MKVVLDTNVLIAALISKGLCAELLEHCIRRHEVISSEFILAEIQEHMTNRFHFSSAEVETAIGLFRTRFVVVTPLPLYQPVCRDADDDAILGTALAGQARCIVTGDKDLLVLKQYQSMNILSAREFLDYDMNA